MMAPAAALLGLVLVATAAFQRPAPQGMRVSTGVSPETVTVGDRFHAFLRVSPPVSGRVRFEPLTPDDSVQQVGRLTALTAPPGAAAVAYPLVAWVAGEPLAATARVGVIADDGSTATFRVPLRLPVVRSVLPEDSAGLRPRPAKPYMAAPARTSVGWLWSGSIALLAALAAGWWLLRRRRGRQAPAPDPRALALARLDALVAAGPPAPSDAAAYLAEAARVLRDYLAAAGDEWGVDLTSRELVEALTGAVGPTFVRDLASLLARADEVKFAGRAMEPEEAVRMAAEIRAWIALLPSIGVRDAVEPAVVGT